MERVLIGVWNLDGGYSAIQESLTIHATQEEADAEVESRVEEVMDEYAWQYEEAELNAVPEGEDDCVFALLHDYVPRKGNDQTNAQLLEAQTRDFISVGDVFATQEFLLDYFDGDAQAAQSLWQVAGAMDATEARRWTPVKSFADERRIIRVWLYVKNFGKCWVVTADANGNNHTAYERGYLEAVVLFDRFAKEVIDSQVPREEGSTATTRE